MSRKYSLTSELRILLWDIDGTLIRSNVSGSYTEYFAPLLVNTFGTHGTIQTLSVSGMTDLEITLNALQEEGITIEHIHERKIVWLEIYEREMRRAMSTGHSWIVLDGVQEILTATKNHTRYHNALLTGNVSTAARLKLESVGLWDFFELPGAFGEESHNRKDLPAIAAKRISQELEIELHPSQFIVIGDTPNDIACARSFGAKAIAVATGRINPPEVLQQYEPDALLLSLEDTKDVLRVLESL